MRLLADENFPLPTIDALRRDGHDVIWVRTDCPASKDMALLDRAEEESRLVLTLDRDFWQLTLQRRIPLRQGGVILFRVHPAVPEAVTPLVRRALSVKREWAAHLSVVTREGVQMIPAHRAGRR